MTCSPLAARHATTAPTAHPSKTPPSDAPATRQPSKLAASRGSSQTTGGAHAQTTTPRSNGKASATVRQRNQRVETYRALVRPIALHYAALCREGADDLIQVGLMGLIRAAERFDASTGTPFSAFARQHVRGAILHYLRDQAPVIRLPRRQQELQDRVRQFSRSWQTRFGQSPSDAELRCGLQLSVAQWCTFERLEQLRRLAPLEASMEGMAADDVSGGDGGGDGGAAEAMALLPRLESRQRQVVEQVVLEGQSLREAARRLQLSPMTVHRALHKGLERLRQELDRGVQQVIPPAGPHRAASASRGC
ncbi:sigma-70 family RNA polymerase sigma factor [Synechococcus sp. ATX 2A4]|uniref:sigma-70 family RNA polymerase sigma factor n=1 Tax=Synechococcus sp. ATX 2A4 TaxID=2823727 RepID=UPI0020CE762C|nr:sigma-70 family RNA polymerase sigma factor [Synechococcus sp. ATX 2A4]MCP9884060.1 sigma-70 family RNA polymerase sigma factor [Synechococcus sp. ATX 2A4]